MTQALNDGFTPNRQYDETGQVVADTTTTADPQILKATGDAATSTAAANRRAANIKYVTIETNIDFTQITEDNSSMFRVSTVIELPVTSAQINDDIAGIITVVTYHGKADLRTLSAVEFEDQILNVRDQKGATALVAPAFGAGVATLDTETKVDELHKPVVGSCRGCLQNNIFKTICPNIAYRPSMTLDNVKQVKEDANENKIRIPMNEIFIRMVNASVTVMHYNFEVDLVQHVMDNMDPEVKTHLEGTYTGHLGVRARDKITQICALQVLQLQSHAEQSESQVIGTREMVSNLTSTALLSVPGYAAAVGDGAGATGSIPALKSQAEATIQQHTPVKDSAWKKGNCFGCNNQNCQWFRDGDVVCPHMDRPGVRERAQLNFKKFKDYKKKMREKRKQEQGWGGLDKKTRVLLTT